MSVVILHLELLVSGIFSVFKPAADEFEWSSATALGFSPDRDRLWPNWKVEHGSATTWP